MTTDRNWQHWHDEIADIPMFDDEKRTWFDAETGLPYDPKFSYRSEPTKSAPYKHSEKTIKSRNIAKFFGGSALKGTARQVKWAEDIRAEKIQAMTEQQAVICCDPNGLMRHSKFWIENRDKSSTDIGLFAEQYKDLLGKYQTAKSGMDKEAVSAIASEYNALTEKWGIE
ncbi:hypothetical protein ABRP72_19700 [Pectobacterium carotovorum]|uniref:hypothetical protein n=1 Tax=Pectobacterium carotovorum TaxID=554 RepID=UPI0032EC5EE4